MKKSAWLAVALAVVMCFVLFACGKKPSIIESTGNTTVIENVKESPDKLDVKQVVYAVSGKLKNYETYKITSSGSTVAKKGFISYKQQIDNVAIKNGDEGYVQAVSDSALVKMKHQAFSKGTGKVAYRNSDQGDISVTTEKDYTDVYGVLPTNADIMNCVFNDESILFAEKISSENGQHKFRYVLDGTEGAAGLRRQMKAYGSLSDYPTFSSLEILLTIDDNYNPISATRNAEYTISKSVIGKMSCTESLTCTYTDLDKTVTIPNTGAFNGALGSTPTVVTPAPTNRDPELEGLVGALVEYDLGKGIALGGTLNAHALGQSISVPIDMAAQIDMAALQRGQSLGALKLDVGATVMGMPIELHLKNGEMYIRVADEKIKGKLDTGSGLEDYRSFVKISKESYGYSLTIADGMKQILNATLAQLGLKLDTAKVEFVVSSDRVTAANLVLDVKNAQNASVLLVGANLLLAEKAYSAPDLSDYVSDVRYAGIQGTLDLNLMGVNPMPIDYDVNLSYDPELLFAGADLLDVITVAVDVDLTKAQGLIGMVNMFAPGKLPENLDGISIYLYKGDLYTYIRGTSADGSLVPVSVSKKALNLGSLNLNGVMKLFSEQNLNLLLQNVEIVVNGQVVTISVQKTILDMINAEITKLIAPIKEQAGAFGSIFDALTITAVTGTVKLDTKELELVIANQMIPITFTAKIKDTANVDKTIFVNFENKYAQEVADIAAAKPVTEAMKNIASFEFKQQYISGSAQWVWNWKNMSLSDETEEKFQRADALYAALTDAQKAKVLIYPGYLNAKTDYATLRAECAEFATEINAEFDSMDRQSADAWTALNRKFDNQYSYDYAHDNVNNSRAYLASLTPDYIAARVERENPDVAALRTKIAEYMTKYDNADSYDAWSAFGQDNKQIDTAYQKLCIASQNKTGAEKTVAELYAEFLSKREEYKVNVSAFIGEQSDRMLKQMKADVEAATRPTESDIAAREAEFEQYAGLISNLNVGSFTYPSPYTLLTNYFTKTYSVFAYKDWIDQQKAAIKTFTDKYDAMTATPYTMTIDRFKSYKSDYKSIYDEMNTMNNARYGYNYYGKEVANAAGFAGLKTKYAAYNTFFASLVEREMGVLNERIAALLAEETWNQEGAVALQTEADALITECKNYDSAVMNALKKLNDAFLLNKAALDLKIMNTEAAALLAANFSESDAKALQTEIAALLTDTAKYKTNDLVKADFDRLTVQKAVIDAKLLDLSLTAVMAQEDAAFDLTVAMKAQSAFEALTTLPEEVRNDTSVASAMAPLTAVRKAALDLRIMSARTAEAAALQGEAFVLADAKALQADAEALIAAYEKMDASIKADVAVQKYFEALTDAKTQLDTKITAAETPVELALAA